MLLMSSLVKFDNLSRKSRNRFLFAILGFVVKLVELA